MPLEEELVLDASPALNTVDQIGRALTDLATQFQTDLADALTVLSEPITADVVVDQAALDDALGGLEDGEVTVDVTTEGAEEAQDEIEATGLVAAEVDGQLVVIDVEAQGADEASAQLEEVGTASGDAAVGAAAAGGALGDLSGQASGAAASLAASALALGGVSLGLSELFANALDATSVQQSFEARTGDAADQVERLDSATTGLDSTLGELALQLGSSDEEVRQAAARLFALGEAEGFGAERTDALIEQVVALAARARALNPELGSVGDIANTMGTRLQRGGRFVADFGISLNAADIQARALANTGKDLATELTLLEKTEAAAQLATEQLGGSLGGDIQANADNVAITFDSLKTSIEEALEPLGEPLISPVFDLLTSLAPIIEDVGAVLADIGVIALEALNPIIEAAAPLVEVWRDNAQEILSALRPAISDLGEAIGDLLIALGPSLAEIQSIMVDLAPALAAILGVLADFIELLALGVEAAQVFAGTLADIVDSVPGLRSLVDALNPFTRLIPQTTERTTNLNRALEEAAQQQLALALATGAFTRAEVEAAVATVAAADGTFSYADALALLRSEQEPAVETTKALNAEVTESERLTKVSAEAWQLLAGAIADGRVTSADYQTVADSLGLTLEQVASFAGEVTGQLEGFADTAAEKLPGVGQLVNDLEAEFQASPDAIITSLQESAQAIANFQGNVAALIAFGFDDIAALAIERGPEFTNELVNTLAVGREGLAQELETALETYEGQLDETGAFIRDEAAPALISDTELAAQGVSTAFGLNLNFEGATAEQVFRARDVLPTTGKELEKAAGGVGAQVTAGFAADLGLESAADAETTRVQSLLEGLGLQGSPLAIAAFGAGTLIGNSFAIGIGNALTTAAGPGGFLNLQARSAIDDLEEAMRQQAEANSPSKLFARIGEDLMEGLAQGVSTVGLPDFGLDQLAAPALQGAAIGGSSVTQSFTMEAGAVQVNVSGAGDPTAVADAVAVKVTEALPRAAASAMLAVEVMAQ